MAMEMLENGEIVLTECMHLSKVLYGELFLFLDSRENPSGQICQRSFDYNVNNKEQTKLFGFRMGDSKQELYTKDCEVYKIPSIR